MRNSLKQFTKKFSKCLWSERNETRMLILLNNSNCVVVSLCMRPPLGCQNSVLSTIRNYNTGNFGSRYRAAILHTKYVPWFSFILRLLLGAEVVSEAFSSYGSGRDIESTSSDSMLRPSKIWNELNVLLAIFFPFESRPKRAVVQDLRCSEAVCR